MHWFLCLCKPRSLVKSWSWKVSSLKTYMLNVVVDAKLALYLCEEKLKQVSNFSGTFRTTKLNLKWPNEFDHALLLKSVILHKNEEAKELQCMRIKYKGASFIFFTVRLFKTMKLKTIVRCSLNYSYITTQQQHNYDLPALGLINTLWVEPSLEYKSIQKRQLFTARHRRCSIDDR